jgi:mannose/fructose/N-acetylgalactosamine-specific phosphotransferase system component IID
MDEYEKKKLVKELDETADNTIKVGLAGPALFGIVSAVAGSSIAVGAAPIVAGAVAVALAWKGYRHLSKDDNK